MARRVLAEYIDATGQFRMGKIGASFCGGHAGDGESDRGSANGSIFEDSSRRWPDDSARGGAAGGPQCVSSGTVCAGAEGFRCVEGNLNSPLAGFVSGLL